MGLWSVPISELDRDTLVEFLNEKNNEGIRLEYKAQVSDVFAKVVAAFANTLGGIIVLGVDEDRKKNEPEWPPDPAKVQYLQDKKGVREQVYNIARDAIYPPVAVQVSKVFDNPHAPGKVLVVVRVDESKDAPHAIEKNQKVFVAEKTDNTTERFGLADMDRIERLLDRRRRVVEQREAMISGAVERAMFHLKAMHNRPRRWVCVCPYYPWKPLCDKQTCYDHFDLSWFGRAVKHRVPDGSYLLGYGGRADPNDRRTLASEAKNNGLVVAIEEVYEAEDNYRYMESEKALEFLVMVVKAARRLYAKCSELPSLVLVRWGFEAVSDLSLFWRRHIASKHPALAHTFQVERVLEYETLKDDPTGELAELYREMAYCFDFDVDVRQAVEQDLQQLLQRP